jgi:hypothetical protein
MSRIKRVAALLVVSALAVPAVPATARDHKRPNVTLRSDGDRQSLDMAFHIRQT